jgi:hypothetical protein
MQEVDTSIINLRFKEFTIDDEEMARAIIAQFITNNTNLIIEGQFSNALHAIKYPIKK